MLPKISIVTPNYNGVRFLEKTILSVISQGYSNLEYIIIDGASTDGSVELIRKYEKKLKYWTSEPDNGTYYAINKGFDRSTGEIMAWINSDDVLWPNSLNHVSEYFLENPQISWIQGLPSIIDENGVLVHQVNPAYSKYFFLTGLYKKPFFTIQQESTFWRRALWQRAGGELDTDFKLAADFDLWIRFFLHEELYCTNTQLAAFRIREGQISEDIAGYISESEQSVKKHLRKFGINVVLLVWLSKILLCNFNRRSNRLLAIQKPYLNWLLGPKKIV